MVRNVREGVLAGLKENPLLQFPLSALQQEKLQRTLGEQSELMQEGVISPEVYGERKAIIEAAFTAQEILNLSHWDIIFEFSSDVAQGEIDLAELHTWSSASCARLTIYPSFYSTSALEKTDAIFHEIIHLYTQPLRRTVSLLTRNGSKEMQDVIEGTVKEHLENVTNALAVVLSARLGISLFKED